MRKFFSRFSTQAPTSQSKLDPPPPSYQSEKDDSSSLTKSPSKRAALGLVPGGGGRTRALAAKFESGLDHHSDAASPSKASVPSRLHSSKQPRRSVVPLENRESLHDPPQLHLPVNDISDIFSINAFASVAGASDTGFKSVPARLPGSSLPQLDSLAGPPSISLDTTTSSGDPSNDAVQQRQPSSGSHPDSIQSSAPKTVAFAPSPEKQRSLPTGAVHPNRVPTNETVLPTTLPGSSFARPTMASQARARSAGKPNEASQTGAVPLAASREKSLSTQSRSAKMSRNNSLQSSARRSMSQSGAPATHEGRIATISGPAPVLPALLNSSLPQSVGRKSLDANLHAAATLVDELRSDASLGQLHFPSRTSLAMQKTGSGSSGPKPGSRRSSFNPSPTLANGASSDAVSFPVAGQGARSFGFPTWSDMTQEELVRNLGPRERTRQEVLWEIVASEERYVSELEKARELYVEALLHPEDLDPERLLPPASTLRETPTQTPSSSRPTSGVQSKAKASARSSYGSAEVDSPNSDLPIASRFMSSVLSPTILDNFSSAGHDGVDLSNEDSPQPLVDRVGPPSSLLIGSKNSLTPTPGYSRPDLSYGLGLGLGTTATRDRSAVAYMHAPVPPKAAGKLSKAQKLRLRSKSADQNDPLRLSVPLPPSLREVLMAMSEGLLEAHELLSEALKARYEEQWPLVRSLADVFMKSSHILEHYGSYVCHLQRAMEELEEAALMERAFRGKKLKRERLSNTVGLGRTVAALELCAFERGFAGLSIFVSMPFQRLLKYPLLFQNLLFHTDPSTHEFESTVAMVVEVERLVRSIEDEKVNAEERDKTRDAFARIDGITDRQVLRPRADRLLIEEQALYDELARRSVSETAPKDASGSAYASDSEAGESGNESNNNRSAGGGRWGNNSGLRAALRNKRSYRRLSDFLSTDERATTSSKAPSMGSKKDLWLVRFSDVEIKCQRIGVTALPMVSTAALTDGREVAVGDAVKSADFVARSKDSRERLKALRSTTLRAKTRNLYKFVSVVAWKNSARQDSGIDVNGENSVGIDEVAEEDEFDEDTGDEAGADVDNSSDSSSSGSDEGVGGLAASDKYIRTTKLSFTYWGDRIEPTSGTTGIGAARTGARPSRLSSGIVPQRSLSSGAETSAMGTGSTRAHRSTASGRLSQPGKRASLPYHAAAASSSSSSFSTRPGSPTKRASATGGVAGRLSEPLAASSITAAPESVQTVVAQMHARQRNEKFGGRLRTSLGPAAGSRVVESHTIISAPAASAEEPAQQ